ncbi:hypothetical protein T484DRAFT_1902166 [Baffinella frigidus]|nr:hypothetical protein T484DRAFT_1902166 [Cryptophyta sp. CCMP2293]
MSLHARHGAYGQSSSPGGAGRRGVLRDASPAGSPARDSCAMSVSVGGGMSPVSPGRQTGERRKERSLDRNGYPGPGTYDVREMHSRGGRRWSAAGGGRNVYGRGASFGTGRAPIGPNLRFAATSPSPNSYATEGGFGMSAPKFKLGSGGRAPVVLMHSIAVPGPGAYGRTRPMRSVPISSGTTTPRFANCFTNPKTPGPGAHIIDRSLTPRHRRDVGGLTWPRPPNEMDRMRQEKLRIKRAVPGPSQYQVKTGLEVGANIKSSPRFRPDDGRGRVFF